MNSPGQIIFYLDWNIISCFKRLDKLPNRKLAESLSVILNFISCAPTNFYFPYSNAHLRDLLNGYPSNKAYIDSDLELLSAVSRNVCVTQYWGEDNPKFHNREVQEHFWDIESDKDIQTQSFEEYFNGISPAMAAVLKIYENVPLNFHLPQDSNPVFRQIFSNAIMEQSMYGLMQDIFELQKSMFSDYTVYKEIRSEMHKHFVISRSGKAPSEVLKAMEKNLSRNGFEQVKELSEKTYSKNAFYDRFMTTYTQLDKFTVLKEKLSKSNTWKQMFNDAMHSFYGGHCNFFITNDSATFEKSKAIYEKFGISTKLYNPNDFAEFLTKYNVQSEGQD